MDMLRTDAVVESTINGLGEEECLSTTSGDDEEAFRLELSGSPILGLDLKEENIELKPLEAGTIKKEAVDPAEVCKQEPSASIKHEPVANVKLESTEDYEFGTSFEPDLGSNSDPTANSETAAVDPLSAEAIEEPAILDLETALPNEEERSETQAPVTKQEPSTADTATLHPVMKQEPATADVTPDGLIAANHVTKVEPSSVDVDAASVPVDIFEDEDPPGEANMEEEVLPESNPQQDEVLEGPSSDANVSQADNLTDGNVGQDHISDTDMGQDQFSDTDMGQDHFSDTDMGQDNPLSDTEGAQEDPLGGVAEAAEEVSSAQVGKSQTEVAEDPLENGHVSGAEDTVDKDLTNEESEKTAELSTTKSPRVVTRKKKKRKNKKGLTGPAKKAATDTQSPDEAAPSEVKTEKKNNQRKGFVAGKKSHKRVADDMESINVMKKKLKTCGKITSNIEATSNLNGKSLQAIIAILRSFSYHQLTFKALWELLRMSFCTVAANENPSGKLQRIMRKVLKVSREHNRLFALTREQFVTFTKIIQKVIEERELAKTIPGMVLAPPRTARTVGIQVQATVMPPLPKPKPLCTDVIELDDEGGDESSSVGSSSDTVTVEPARMETDTDSDSSQPSTPKTPLSSIAPTLHARLSGNVTIHPVTVVQKKQTPGPRPNTAKPIPTQTARKGTTYAHPLATRISNSPKPSIQDNPDKNTAMFRVKKLAANGELTIKSSRQGTVQPPTQSSSPAPRKVSGQEVIDLTDTENVNLTPTISADSVRTISKRMSAAMEASKSSSSVRPKSRLPSLPVAPSKYPNGPTPPRPILSVARSNTGVIVLSWNFPDGVNPSEEITFFQVYSYQESKDATAGPGWNKVGHIKALELPMACKLHQLVTGHRYYFAVRAMDQCQRLGPFSSIESIQVTPLPNRTKT